MPRNLFPIFFSFITPFPAFLRLENLDRKIIGAQRGEGGGRGGCNPLNPSLDLPLICQSSSEKKLLCNGREKKNENLILSNKLTNVYPASSWCLLRFPREKPLRESVLIFHWACAKYVTPHVMYLTSICLISREIMTQQTRPNAAIT